MPLILEAHDSLTYIDSEPTTTERTAAQALIDAELGPTSSHHPHLPDLPDHHFSPLAEAELERIASEKPLKAVDLSRYEALEPPSSYPESDVRDPETLRVWREALCKAYTSHTYLTGRQTNLAMLECFGKNAWLIGNSQADDVLKSLVNEQVEVKRDIDICLLERKNAQEGVGAEMKGLAETWKKGVARVLETEIAVEMLNKELEDARRRAG